MKRVFLSSVLLLLFTFFSSASFAQNTAPNGNTWYKITTKKNGLYRILAAGSYANSELFVHISDEAWNTAFVQIISQYDYQHLFVKLDWGYVGEDGSKYLAFKCTPVTATQAGAVFIQYVMEPSMPITLEPVDAALVTQMEPARLVDQSSATLRGEVIANNFIERASTLDLAPAGKLITNGTNNGGGATNRSFSSSTSLSAGQYMTVDLGGQYGIHYVSFGTWWSGDPRFIPSAYDIHYSTDGSAWSKLVSVTNNSNVSPLHETNITARFWRLTVVSPQTGQGGSNISGFRLIAKGMGSVAVKDLWNTSFNSPTIFTHNAVSIGTVDTHGHMLAVNGSIRAKEIKVEANNWPDYVFSKNHNRPSLDKLDAYIKANNHLPGIPSAKEVEVDGVNLGEMNKKLLQKIEELTLYMIEMKKENGNLQGQINDLNKKLSNTLK